MNSIAILGPVKTFTDIAARAYIEATDSMMKPTYYPTITKTFNAIGNECNYGIIPIENTIDGYVQVTLDLLAKGGLKIIHEIILPIDFTFITKQKRPEEVNSLYVQFKTHNQCLNFIENLGEIDIVTTPSNGASYNAYMEDNSCDAVIIPAHSIDAQTTYNYRVDHVADSTDNETRFVILSTNSNKEEREWTPWRTSFVVSNDKDRPGLLSDILNAFSVRGINLLSIISRPKKNGLGNYNFFIDIEGCYQKSSIVKEAVQVIMKDYDIKILGSYYNVQHEYHTKLSSGSIR